MIAAIASALASPLIGPEFTSVPSPGVAIQVWPGTRQPGVHHPPGRPARRRGRSRGRADRAPARHDGPGAVVGEHVVGGRYREALAVDRVDRVRPRKTPVFARSVDCRSISVSFRTCST